MVGFSKLKIWYIELGSKRENKKWADILLIQPKMYSSVDTSDS